MQSNEGICFALAWPVFDNWEWVVAPVHLFSKGSLLVFQLLWQPSPNLSLLFKVCGTIIKFDYWYLGKWLIFWKSWRPLRVWGLICEPVHIKLKFELLGWTWREGKFKCFIVRKEFTCRLIEQVLVIKMWFKYNWTAYFIKCSLSLEFTRKCFC